MRLFVALDLPSWVKDHLSSVVDDLREPVPGARWVPRANLHVTLAFLGSVADERVAAVSDALGAAVADLVDFPAHLDGVGAFPSARRARVLWAGLRDHSGGLEVLAESVVAAIEPLGFPRERRAFTPHATLARLPDPRAVDLPAVELDATPFRVDRITLFRSRLGRPAPVYDPVAIFPFRREPAAPGSSG